MLPDKLPMWVHRKRVKGRVYLYFQTGQVTPKGKAIAVRLPDYQDPAFHRKYAELRDRREGRGAPGSMALTVPAFCEKFRRSVRFKSRKKNTRDSYETYLRVIESELDTFHASEVEPTDVAALLEKMSDRPGAANQCVRTLSAMYSWGKSPKVGLVKHNPAVGAELYEGGEHDPWPEWLLAEALKAKTMKVRRAAGLLYFTGQRIGDVCAMRWTDIRGDHLTVKQEKTEEELTIRLHRDLAAILEDMPRGLTTILAKPDGTAYDDGTVREWLKAFARERGVKAVPHGLRKNAVNALLEAGCSAAQVSAVTGQSLQMVEHYARKRDRKKLSGAAVLLWENGGRT